MRRPGFGARARGTALNAPERADGLPGPRARPLIDRGYARPARASKPPAHARERPAEFEAARARVGQGACIQIQHRALRAALQRRRRVSSGTAAHSAALHAPWQRLARSRSVDESRVRSGRCDDAPARAGARRAEELPQDPTRRPLTVAWARGAREGGWSCARGCESV
jgi:hypothetical protein